MTDSTCKGPIHVVRVFCATAGMEFNDTLVTKELYTGRQFSQLLLSSASRLRGNLNSRWELLYEI
jgi:hypothetical protein